MLGRFVTDRYGLSMAWEWLTAGVVPGVSVLASTGLAWWTNRQQQVSTDKQIEAERKRLIEERTWEKQESTLVMLCNVARELHPLDEPTALIRSVYVIRDNMAQVELYTSKDVRNAAAAVYNAIHKFTMDDAIVSQHHAALQHRALEVDAARKSDISLTRSMESLRINTENKLYDLITAKMTADGTDLRTPCLALISAARTEINGT